MTTPNPGPARLIARGVEGDRPAWMRHTDGEARWLAAGGLTLSIVLQVLMPQRYALEPRFIAPLIEVVLLVVVAITNPTRTARRTPAQRALAIALLAVVAAFEAISVGLLVHDIVAGHGIKAVSLLSGAVEIWVTNVLIFGLIYWEYDRGGPGMRAQGIVHVPDLLFPQMSDEELAKDWEPRFTDYLFVSFTNSTAYSPTDTMPLSSWCKALFTVQSLLSLVTITLVTARAVNILPGN